MLHYCKLNAKYDRLYLFMKKTDSVCYSLIENLSWKNIFVRIITRRLYCYFSHFLLFNYINPMEVLYDYPIRLNRSIA